jgi:hypothetical protein
MHGMGSAGIKPGRTFSRATRPAGAIGLQPKIVASLRPKLGEPFFPVTLSGSPTTHAREAAGLEEGVSDHGHQSLVKASLASTKQLFRRARGALKNVMAAGARGEFNFAVGRNSPGGEPK